MKNCPHCKVNVMGDKQVCPLCQNDLRGEGTKVLWPDSLKLKKQSLVYRIQLFVTLSCAITALALDFLFDLWNQNMHWSLVILLWVAGGQFTVVYLYKTYTNIIRLVTISVLHCLVILICTAYFLKFMPLCISIIVPIMLSACLVFDFICCLVDRSGTSIVYLLFIIVISGLSYGALFTRVGKSYMVWNICVLLCAIAVMGMIVFQGKKFFVEIQKRMSV